MALQIQLQKDDTVQTVEVDVDVTNFTPDECTAAVESAISEYDYDIYVVLGDVQWPRNQLHIMA